MKKYKLNFLTILLLIPMLAIGNDCESGISEKKLIACSEKNLNGLINEKLNSETEFKGNVFIYLTVTEKAEIIDIKVKSYPQSDEIDILVKQATEEIKVRTAKYKNKIVKSRLWTKLEFE